MAKSPIVPIFLPMDQVRLIICLFVFLSISLKYGQIANSSHLSSHGPSDTLFTDAVADADIGCSQDFKTKYLWHHRISGTVSLNMEKLKMEMTKCDSDEQECPRESLCFS